MGLQRFPLGDFSGGWNVRDAPQSLETNQSQSQLNVTVADVIGALSQRLGKTPFGNQLPYAIDNIRPWYPSESTKYLIASAGGRIYRISATGVPTELFIGTAGTIWNFEQATDGTGAPYMWCMNGTDTPQKIDAAGAIAVWANNPPNGTIMRLWRNRMVVAGHSAHPQRLFFSFIGDPEKGDDTNPTDAEYGTNWLDIKGTEEDLEPVVALEVFGDDLYGFKRKSIWAVNNSNSPWDNQRITVGLGCADRYQTCVLQDKMYFFNNSGIWSLSAGTLQLKEESDNVKPLWTTRVNHSQLSKARMMALPNNRIACALPLDSSENNNYMLELIPGLSYKRVGLRRSILLPSVCPHDYKIHAFCPFRPGDQDVVIAADHEGNMHQLFNGINDDGVAIEAHLMTGWRPLINEEPYERIRRINVEMNGQVTVDVYGDFREDPDHTDVLSTTEDTDPNWEGGTWNGGVWDPVLTTDLTRTDPESWARYHAVKFSNSELDKTFTIYAAELVFRGGKAH